MTPLEAPYYFALCQPHCQALLKQEVSMRYPGLRLSYSRPGLVTFKAEAPLTSFEPWLALASGRSVGRVARAALLGGDLPLDLPPRTAIRLWRPNAIDAAPEEVVDSHDLALLRFVGTVGDAGECLEVIDLGPAEEGMIWLGRANLVKGRSPSRIRITPPERAPSRAYAKLSEVLRYFDVPVEPQGVVLELGAAPGGASLALLEHGLHVIAVDPGEVSEEPRREAEARGLVFRHVAKKASALDSRDLENLPREVGWLISDINLAPPVAMTQVRRALALVKRSVHTIILTWKMNDAKALRTVEQELIALRGVTHAEPEIVHLPSHRREFAVIVRKRPH